MSAVQLLDLIGNTPLVELQRLAPKSGIRLLAKLEGQNPSGSIKDRIALAMVQAAEERGDTRPGDTLVEASTGNTAIALAIVARQRGYQLKVVIPRGVVPSIEDVLSVLGVEIIWAEPKVGMLGAIQKARELGEQPGWYCVHQFEDPENPAAHYRTTGEEVARALPKVDVLVSGVGTGGTIMGVGRRLREANPDLQVIGVEPRIGEKLQGLRSLDEGYHPPLLDLDYLNGRIRVGSDRALERAREVMRAEGILAGVSSGAVLHAALRHAKRVDRAVMVLMFSDGAWKYLPSKPWDAAGEGDERLDDMHWW